jgi:hypothetical protein
MSDANTTALSTASAAPPQQAGGEALFKVLCVGDYGTCLWRLV